MYVHPYILHRTHVSFDYGSEQGPHLEQVNVSETGCNTAVQDYQTRMPSLLNQDIARMEVAMDKVVNEELAGRQSRDHDTQELVYVSA